MRDNVHFWIQAFGDKDTGKECKGIVRDVVDEMEQHGSGLVINILTSETKNGAAQKEMVC